MDNKINTPDINLESLMDKKLKFGREMGLVESVKLLKRLSFKYKIDSLLIRLFEKHILTREQTT